MSNIYPLVFSCYVFKQSVEEEVGCAAPKFAKYLNMQEGI